MCDKPTDFKLFPASTLFIRLNIVPTTGRKATVLDLLSVDLNADGG
jgi:hypothetical protein